MSNYKTTKHHYSVDIVRTTDNHAFAAMCSLVYYDGGKHTYYQADDDEVKSGAKNEGEIKETIEAAKGFVQKDYDWDAELKRVFGEVDADIKKELEDYFTSDLKAKYLAYQKSLGPVD